VSGQPGRNVCLRKLTAIVANHLRRLLEYRDQGETSNFRAFNFSVFANSAVISFSL
jgi:hypothetical protein